jgi:hypothetical protein
MIGANCHRVTTSARPKGGSTSSPMPPRLLAPGQARRSTRICRLSGGRGIRTHGDVAATMVFKSIRDSLSAAAPTWAFSVSACCAIQDHPAYIPCGQRWPLRPELAAPLGVWSSSQLAQCAGGRADSRLSGGAAVLPCCTVRRISSSVMAVRIGSSRTDVIDRSSLDDAARW